MGQPNLDLKKLFPNPFTGLNQMARQVHQVNVKNGFYDNPQEAGTHVALIHAEVSELLTSYQKGKQLDQDLNLQPMLGMDDDVFMAAYKTTVKGSKEEEFADIIISTFDWSDEQKVNLELHVALKLRYNSLRGYMHGNRKF